MRTGPNCCAHYAVLAHPHHVSQAQTTFNLAELGCCKDLSEAFTCTYGHCLGFGMDSTKKFDSYSCKPSDLSPQTVFCILHDAY